MGIFLKNKNYQKFTLASWLSTAGNILFYLALMTYASKLKNYSLALSLIAITEAFPDLIGSISGYLADRTRNKYQVIIWLAIIRFALYMLVGLLFVTDIAGWNLVLMIIGLNFISDLSGMYSGGLQTPLIVDLVGEDEMAEAEGFTNGVSDMITMLAQFAGSGLLLFMSYSQLAIVNALTFLIAGLLYANVWFTVRKQIPDTDSQPVNEQGFLQTISNSFKQVKKAGGLLTVVCVIALLNGILSTIEPLFTIIIAGNKNMLIGTYSFTIALIGAIVSIGTALGSTIGTTIFKKVTIFLLILLDNVAAALTIGAILSRNIIFSMIFSAFLGFFAGVCSPKLVQWLVTAVNHEILSSSVGLLNTILAIAGPLTTTVFTSISGIFGANLALALLILLSICIFIVALTVMIKVNKNKVVETETTEE